MGPRQRPHQPLRAAQFLKPPALPGDIYIVAVNAMESHAREIDAVDALLGRPVIEFVQMADARREERATRNGDGLS